MLSSESTDERAVVRNRQSAQRRESAHSLPINRSAESSAHASVLANAPRVVAQRQQLDAAFGAVGQRQGRPRKEGVLQDKRLPVQRKVLATQGTVQRKIGLEYEIGAISTTKTNVFGRQKLNKKDVVVTGAGFKVEADEETTHDPAYPTATYNGYSDLEFVTDAFSVDAPGFNAMRFALNDIAEVAGYIKRHPNQDIPASDLPGGTGTANRYLRFPGGVMIGKPQATVGLRLSALDQLFQDVATNPGAPVGAVATTSQSVFGGGLDPAGMGAPMGGGAQNTGIATIGLARAAADAETTATLQPMYRSADLTGLVALLVRYLVQGYDGAAGYGKTIAAEFMMRTDFATAFAQLPNPGRNFFQQSPVLFSLLVCRAARRVRAGIGDSGQVFEGGIYTDNFKYGPASAEAKTAAQKAVLSNSLRRRDWLTGIASGQDLLTATTFPNSTRTQRNEIESLGSYGVNMDIMPGAGGNLPLVEMRGLPSIQPGIFPALALDLFQYVYTLNTGGGGGMPGGMVNIPIGDRTDLANLNSPMARLKRQQLMLQAQNAVAAWMGASGG